MQWLINARVPSSLGAARPAIANAEMPSLSFCLPCWVLYPHGCCTHSILQGTSHSHGAASVCCQGNLTEGDTARDRKWVKAEKMVLPSTQHYLSTRSALAGTDSLGEKDTST